MEFVHSGESGAVGNGDHIVIIKVMVSLRFSQFAEIWRESVVFLVTLIVLRNAVAERCFTRGVGDLKKDNTRATGQQDIRHRGNMGHHTQRLKRGRRREKVKKRRLLSP